MKYRRILSFFFFYLNLLPSILPIQSSCLLVSYTFHTSLLSFSLFLTLLISFLLHPIPALLLSLTHSHLLRFISVNPSLFRPLPRPVSLLPTLSPHHFHLSFSPSATSHHANTFRLQAFKIKSLDEYRGWQRRRSRKNAGDGR